MFDGCAPCATAAAASCADALDGCTANIAKAAAAFGAQRDGIDDATFQRIFQPVMRKVMEVYRPGAVVLQCGADSLGNDRLGCFSLSLDGHADCIRFMKRLW